MRSAVRGSGAAFPVRFPGRADVVILVRRTFLGLGYLCGNLHIMLSMLRCAITSGRLLGGRHRYVAYPRRPFSGRLVSYRPLAPRDYFFFGA